MASRLEFVQYAAEQLSGAGISHTGKCLGNMEFTVMEKYLRSFVMTSFLLKKTEAGRKLCPGLEEAPPTKEPNLICWWMILTTRQG